MSLRSVTSSKPARLRFDNSTRTRSCPFTPARRAMPPLVPPVQHASTALLRSTRSTYFNSPRHFLPSRVIPVACLPATTSHFCTRPSDSILLPLDSTGLLSSTSISTLPDDSFPALSAQFPPPRLANSPRFKPVRVNPTNRFIPGHQSTRFPSTLLPVPAQFLPDSLRRTDPVLVTASLSCSTTPAPACLHSSHRRVWPSLINPPQLSSTPADRPARFLPTLHPLLFDDPSQPTPCLTKTTRRHSPFRTSPVPLHLDRPTRVSSVRRLFDYSGPPSSSRRSPTTRPEPRLRYPTIGSTPSDDPPHGDAYLPGSILTDLPTQLHVAPFQRPPTSLLSPAPLVPTSQFSSSPAPRSSHRLLSSTLLPSAPDSSHRLLRSTLRASALPAPTSHIRSALLFPARLTKEK